MTTLTLARLAEIEQAAADAIQWRTLTANGHHFGNVCDPATVAALCRDARRYVWLHDNATPPTLASIAWGHSIAACEFSYSDDAIDAAIRAAGLTT